ncbi:MAG: aspartate aminotransferase family protein [Candidatus Caldarchaeum sp.]
MDRFLELRRLVSPGVALVHPITIMRGENAVLMDSEGRRYIDFTSGIGVVNLGHGNPEIGEAVEKALKNLWHLCFMVANYPGYVEVVEKLVETVPGDFEKRGALFNSGAEAVENAVKIARHVAKRPYAVSFENSFHGRTYLAMALTGKYEPYKVDFEPFPSAVEHVPFPYCYRCPFGQSYPGCGLECMDYVKKHFFKTRVPPHKIACFIIEPIQGEGGFVPAPPEYLRELRSVCDEHGIVFIDDEVQTGFCRTGRFYAIEHSGVAPDLVTVGKALANGLPLSAVAGKASLMDNMPPGSLGSTFGGNPVACAAAVKVFEIMKRDDLAGRAMRLGELIAERLGEFFERFELVGDVRGLGVMRAFELVKDRRSKEPAVKETSMILEHARRRGLLLLKAGLYSNVVRLHPPLTIEEELLYKGLDTVEECLKEVSKQPS